MTRKKRRLTIIGLALGVFGGAVGISLYALRDTIVFFYGPTEYAQKAPAPGTRLRRFGFVTTNSITQSFSRRVIEARLAPAGDDPHPDPPGVAPPF